MKVSPDSYDSNNGLFFVYQNGFRKVYQLRIDLEEAKGQEFLKAIEEASDIVEETAPIHVEDNQKIDKLSAEVEELKHLIYEGMQSMAACNEFRHKKTTEAALLVQTDFEEAKAQEILKLQNSPEEMETKVDETNTLLTKEREYAQKAIEALAIVQETSRIHVEDTENIDKLSAEVEELKSLLESERKRANESEKKCKEALVSSEIKQQKLEETVNRANELQDSMNRLQEKLSNIDSENKVLRHQVLTTELPRPPRQLRYGYVVERPQMSLNQKQRGYQDLLIRCIAQPLGFSKGRPVAACIVYKCLRQWRSFEAEKTNIFDRIIQVIVQAIETQNKNDLLAYWLSNASTLLLLLQSTFGAKYPVLLFKQQLRAYVEKMYQMIRDNLKKEISPLVELCIEPQTLKRTESTSSDDILVPHWQGIVKKFRCFLKLLKYNNVPPFFVREIFTQIFYLINVHLFNRVLLERECCSLSYGEFVKLGLSELENWCYKTTEEYAGSAWFQLKHIRQAVGFLVVDQKQEKTLDEIRHDLCPSLSIQQLYRFCTMYWDDKHGTNGLSPDVISNMKVLMAENSNVALSSHFLLDYDSSIPFSAEDLSKLMDQINIEDVKPPPLIRDDPGFSFLLPLAES